jgi:hypothetical protein
VAVAIGVSRILDESHGYISLAVSLAHMLVKPGFLDAMGNALILVLPEEL